MDAKTYHWLDAGAVMTVAEGGRRDKANLKCPACGAEMNFHAEKINQSARVGAEKSLGGELNESGEVVEEIHTCPVCATIATRRAD
jgi:rubrerythrin